MQTQKVSFWLSASGTVVSGAIAFLSGVAADLLPAWLARPAIFWPIFVTLLIISIVIKWRPELFLDVGRWLRDRVVGLWSWIRRLKPGVVQVVVVVLIVLAVGLLPVLLPAEAVSPPEPCPSPVVLTVLTDVAMVEPASEIADALINVGDCRRADFHVYSSGREDAIGALASRWQDDRLRAVGAEPAVWIPASRADVEHVIGEDNAPDLEVRGPVASAAVVVAILPEQREAVGLSRYASWSEILDSELRLVRASQTLSTTAVLATTAMYQSFEGEPGAGARRREIEQVIEPMTGSDITKLCEVGAAADDGAAVGVITTEQAMSRQGRNTLELCGETYTDDPMFEAIYPSDGTYVQDYPYVLLPAATQHPRRLEIAEDLYDKLTSGEGQRRLGSNLFRDLEGEITQRYGALVNGPASPPEIPDAPTVTLAMEQWSSARRPITALVAVDVSGSMDRPVAGQNTDRMSAARQGVQRIVDRIIGNPGGRADLPGDRVGLWEFSTSFSGGQDHRRVFPITSVNDVVREDLLESLAAVQATDGDTGLYDTIIAGMEHLRAQEDDRAEEADRAEGGIEALDVLVVVTDGLNDDPEGGASLEDVISSYNSGPPVHVVLLTFGNAACTSADLHELAAAGLDCLDGGANGIDRAAEQFSDGLWGTP